MSQENAEVALAAAEAWNRGDREALMILYDEEAEFYANQRIAAVKLAPG